MGRIRRSTGQKHQRRASHKLRSDSRLLTSLRYSTGSSSYFSRTLTKSSYSLSGGATPGPPSFSLRSSAPWVAFAPGRKSSSIVPSSALPSTLLADGARRDRRPGAAKLRA